MAYPQVIPLKGRVEGRAIQFWWLGKWRGVRYYGCTGVPSKRITNEALVTFRLGAGLNANQQFSITWE